MRALVERQVVALSERRARDMFAGSQRSGSDADVLLEARQAVRAVEKGQAEGEGEARQGGLIQYVHRCSATKRGCEADAHWGFPAWHRQTPRTTGM